VPCFNEKGTIQQVVEHTRSVMERIASSYDITVIDDGSTDGSKAIVEALVAEYPEVQARYHAVNKGLGTVLREGYLGARYENVCSVPGDGQFNPDELIEGAPVKPGTFVSFYRRENLTYSFFRNKLSYVHRKLNKLLVNLDLRDINWVLVLKTQEFEKLDLHLHSTLIKSEICAKLIYLGYRPAQVASEYQPRVYGQSKGSSFKIVKQAALDTLKLMWVVNVFKLTHRKLRNSFRPQQAESA